MNKPEQLIQQLESTLGPTDAQRVAPFVLPAIGLHDGTLGPEPEALGTTRFGGRPDLPAEVPWPESPNGPLAFLGQVALSEVAPFDHDNALPAQGILSFFYDIHALGHDPADRERYAVVYLPPNTKLIRCPFSDEIMAENQLDQARSVQPYLYWQLPTCDRLAQQTLGFGEMDDTEDEFTQRYWFLDEALFLPHIPVGTHQLLGWANGLYQQGEDARLFCELAHRGFPEDGSEQAADAIKHRADWRCLLEISDDRKLYNTSWQDGGTLVFMIRDADLRNADFTQCWCVLSSS